MALSLRGGARVCGSSASSPAHVHAAPSTGAALCCIRRSELSLVRSNSNREATCAEVTCWVSPPLRVCCGDHQQQ
jgi:hypothetical protein